MYWTHEELVQLYRQARRDHPKSNLLAAQKIKATIFERGLEELLPTVTDPEQVAILRRVVWMLARAGFYRLRGSVILMLTDLAPQAIEMVTILRDMAVYTNDHWDALVSNLVIAQTDRTKLVADIELMNGFLEQFQTEYAANGVIKIRSAHFEDMDRTGPEFLSMLLGLERVRTVIGQANVAFREIRTISKVERVSDAMSDMPKDKMS